LADAIKLIAWQVKSKIEIHSYSLKEEFIHCYGSHEDILNAHNLNVNEIGSRI
jgi:transketolase